MRIAHLEPPSQVQHGDQIYRTQQPCQALAQVPHVEVVSGSWLTPAMQTAMLHADLAILCQTFDADLLPLLRQRQAAGKKSVVEINDNFCDPQPFNPAASFYKQPQNHALVLQLSRLADGLQFSSSALQKRFGTLNKRTAVFPNQLAQRPAHLAAKPYYGPCWLGWAGSLGHRDDLAAVVPALRYVMDVLPHVQLAVMGPAALAPLFDWVPAQRLRWAYPGTMAAYQQFLRTLHVGIAPLLDTPFNACRSDIKFVEYAAGGAVFVGSRRACYEATVQHGHNGFLLDTLSEFGPALVAICQNRALQTALRQAAFAAIATRTQAQDTQHRLAFYQAVGVAQKAVAPILATGAAHKYTQCAWTAFEHNLFAALQSHSQPAQALAFVRRAQALRPTHYLPYLLAGAYQQDAAGCIDTLRRATALQPHSCLAWCALADVLGQQDKRAAARHAYRQCLASTPNFAPAHEGLARLALQAGNTQRAALHLRNCLNVNQDYRIAAARLAVLHIEAQAYEQAVDLLQETIATYTPSWFDFYLLGDALCHLRRFAEASWALDQVRQDAPEAANLARLKAKALAGQGHTAAGCTHPQDR